MKNKRGDIPITLLCIGVVTICIYALFSFSFTNAKIRNLFDGLSTMENMSSYVEESYFYEGNNERNLKEAISYAQNNQLVNRVCNCGRNCEDYAAWILDACSKEGIPDPVLFFSLMMQESECLAGQSSDSSVGLMMIKLDNCGDYELPSDSEKCRLALIDNPQLNIQTGAKILKEKYNLFPEGKTFLGCSNRGINYIGWEAALRGYNGWDCNLKYPAQDYFVDEVLKRYKMLKGTYSEIIDVKKGIIFSTEYIQ